MYGKHWSETKQENVEIGAMHTLHICNAISKGLASLLAKRGRYAFSPYTYAVQDNERAIRAKLQDLTPLVAELFVREIPVEYTAKVANVKKLLQEALGRTDAVENPNVLTITVRL